MLSHACVCVGSSAVALHAWPRVLCQPLLHPHCSSFCCCPSTQADTPAALEPDAVWQVDIVHCGVYHFKGVSDLQTVMQLNTRRLAGRTFSQTPPSHKTRVISGPRGLQVSCRLLPPRCR